MSRPDRCFPPQRRLRSAAEFAGLYRRGRRLRCGPLRVRWQANGGSGARLGLAIAKRQVRSAAGRNRIKRLIREAFRCHWQALPAVDLAISIQAPAGGRLDEAELKDALSSLWQQLNAQFERS